MNKKILVLVFVGLFLISMTGATQKSLGTFKKGDCIQLIQSHGNATYNNISAVYYTNNATIFNINTKMTKVETFYNYTFCNTSFIGEYIVNGFGDPDGDKTSWTYNFFITGTGFELTQSRTNLSMFSIGLLVLLLLACAWLLAKLPSGDNRDEEGVLLSINQLKYIRPIIYIFMWFMTMGIFFTTSNLALSYIGTDLIGDILFVIFQIMFKLSLPMVVVWFVYIFYSIFQDRKMKGYIERGIDQ